MNTDILPARGLILCAVSGGVDSMYLLCRLRELGYSVAAAHYHHGLRGADADRDEAFVRDFCRTHEIPCRAERGDVRAYAAAHGQGVEEAARALRYAFLERAADELRAACVATAHTADDNAETILLHMTRGAGLTGLCGIPPVRGRIVRPMLEVTRAEAERYLAEHGIDHVEDATNRQDVYARNRVRHNVMPALKAENPAFVSACARMASLLRQDEEYLDGLARAFLREHARGDSVSASALAALPRPVALRAIRHMAGVGLSAAHAETILRVAERGGAADVHGLRAARTGGRLVFGARPSPPLPERALTIPGRTALPEAGFVVLAEKIDVCPAYVHKSFNTFYFKCENICGSISVGARKPGERCRPRGRGCTKTVKALLAENGVPAWERDAVPVLRDGTGVLGVFGCAADERVCAAPGDKDVIQIQFIRLTPENGGCADASGYRDDLCQ